MNVFDANIYRVNKGSGRVESYIAILTKSTFQSLKISTDTAVLIKDKNEQVFPTKIVKRSRSYAFTVPRRIGKNYDPKIQHT